MRRRSRFRALIHGALRHAPRDARQRANRDHVRRTYSHGPRVLQRAGHTGREGSRAWARTHLVRMSCPCVFRSSRGRQRAALTATPWCWGWREADGVYGSKLVNAPGTVVALPHMSLMHSYEEEPMWLGCGKVRKAFPAHVSPTVSPNYPPDIRRHDVLYRYGLAALHARQYQPPRMRPSFPRV